MEIMCEYAHCQLVESVLALPTGERVVWGATLSNKMLSSNWTPKKSRVSNPTCSKEAFGKK